MRKKMPEVSIRTTIIVGFPGETEEEFQDLMDFLKEVRFDRLGAFKFITGYKVYKLPDGSFRAAPCLSVMHRP